MKHPAYYCCVGINPPLSRGFKSSQSSHKEQIVAPARDDHLSWHSSISSQIKASSIFWAVTSIGKSLGTCDQNFLNFIYMLLYMVLKFFRKSGRKPLLNAIPKGIIPQWLLGLHPKNTDF